MYSNLLALISFIVVILFQPSQVSPFLIQLETKTTRRATIAISYTSTSRSTSHGDFISSSSQENTNNELILIDVDRREMLSKVIALAVASLPITPLSVSASASAADPKSNLMELRSLIEEATKQIEVVPDLIKEEKWDAVRALLIKKPLFDMWNKNTPVLKAYADAIGDNGGDEFAVLEEREELIGHLRYLDMAVYNNVFNPISTVGEVGATKALIDSYRNDPIREYKASKQALDQLLQLAN